MSALYKDDSIFQGWKEFAVPGNLRVRAEIQPGLGYNIYIMDENEDTPFLPSYFRRGFLFSRKPLSCRKIWQEWIMLQDYLENE